MTDPVDMHGHAATWVEALLSTVRERDALREELAAYKGAVEQIQRAITEYKTDRMWASALRRIESLTHRPEIDIVAQREQRR